MKYAEVLKILIQIFSFFIYKFCETILTNLFFINFCSRLDNCTNPFFQRKAIWKRIRSNKFILEIVDSPINQSRRNGNGEQTVLLIWIKCVTQTSVCMTDVLSGAPRGKWDNDGYVVTYLYFPYISPFFFFLMHTSISTHMNDMKCSIMFSTLIYVSK